MLSFFEKLTTAYPAEDPSTPPENLFAFFRHYSRGMEWPLIALAVLTAIIAALEVMLFGFLGQLVDWLGNKTRKPSWPRKAPPCGLWRWCCLSPYR